MKDKEGSAFRYQCLLNADALLKKLPSVLLMIGIFSTHHSLAQEERLLFSQAFTHKCRHFDLDFLSPIESVWLPTGLNRDDFLKYDLALTNQQGVEIRVIMDELDPRASRSPNVRFSTVLSTLATNDQDSDITVNMFTSDQAERFYNASWAALAEFIPKKGLTDKPKGLLQCIYLPGRAQVFVIVLFDTETLPTAYSRLMMFKNELVTD